LAAAWLLACSSSSGAKGSPDGATGDGGGTADSSGHLPDGGKHPRTDSGKPPPESGADATESSVGIGLSAKYPGDMGIGKDPAVVWAELFDEGSVAAFTARYDSSTNPAGMTLMTDAPAKSAGKASMKLTSSGDGANATDFYKELLPGYDDWFVRWYAKYDPAVQWHHTGVWFGGYDPPITYPFPHAGLKPAGNDRFSVSIDPIWNVGSAKAQFDFYNYWMNMHSWMAMPSGSTAYYGNALVNENGFSIDEASWVCIEVHVALNTDPAAGTGGVLEVWKNDDLVQSFTTSGPEGYWIRDKFCTMSADGTQCTSYPAPFTTVLDLQWRSTLSLQLNYFWPQNYITTTGVTGSAEYANMIVATQRVGCIQ
jgi:hypothetical protein